MGLAIDGNVVHGIARGGQAFLSVADTNADGSINIGGQDYLSANKIVINQIGEFDLGLSQNIPSATTDVTSQLSDYVGQWAILKIHNLDNGMDDQFPPIIVPTAPTTEKLSVVDDWAVSLSRDTKNTLTLTVSTTGGYVTQAEGSFYIITK